MSLTKVSYSMITGAPANVLDYGADPTGATSSHTAFANALLSGANYVYVPPGTYTMNNIVSISITNNVVFYGEGTITYNGASNNNPWFSIEVSNNTLTVKGLTFNGGDLITGGLRVYNTASPSSNTLPNLYIQENTFIFFKMNTANIWNNAVYIAGSFQTVFIQDNNIRNITRAAGTGNSGSNGTCGVAISPTYLQPSQFIRSCIHTGNSYSNISGGDAVGSAGNVDYDAFKFFAPDPTNFSNQYPESTLTSSGNTFRNCRGRAIKLQATGVISNETIIRDDDYTITGGSTEINLQWGVGTVSNCQFFYRPYGGGGSSPIGGLTLISFYDGVDYGEALGSAIVNGIQVFNSIPAGVGNNIAQVVSFLVGNNADAQRPKPLVSISNVAVNKNQLDWLVTFGEQAGGYGTLRMDSIIVPSLRLSAIGVNAPSPDYDIVATNVVNLDGVATPANCKPFVTDTYGAAVSYSGQISGALNQGFLNAYSVSATLNQAPMLNGAALADPYGSSGGATSVQSAYLADEASKTFDSRFFNTSNGMILISVSYGYSGQGVFACGSNGVYSMAVPATNIFSPSTTGSNLDTAGKLNLWFTGGALNVKNRLGGAYSVTVTFIG